MDNSAVSTSSIEVVDADGHSVDMGKLIALRKVPNNQLTPEQKIILRQGDLIMPSATTLDIGASLKVCNIGPYCGGDMGSLQRAS